MARTRTSRSQLFHYFPDGKDELLLAVAHHEADRVLADQQPHLGDLSTWAAWQAWRDTLVARYRAQGEHCPLATVNSELGRNSPGARAVSAELMRRWRGEIAEGIRRLQATGQVDPALDATRSAAALLAGIQGGVLLLHDRQLGSARSRPRRRDRAPQAVCGQALTAAATRPPSTSSTVPCTNAASSEAR